MSEPVATAPNIDKRRRITQMEVGVNKQTTIRMPSTKPNLRAKSVSRLFACHVFIWLFLLMPVTGSGQTQTEEQKETCNLRLIVKPVVKNESTKLQLKRFYLIKGSRDENKALIDKIKQRPLLTRECYYRNKKVSEAFINWLIKEVNCESVYCKPIEEQFLSGPTAVPEFQEAYERSVKEYKSPKLGRLWLTTNLTDDVRDGFYRQKQAAIKELVGDGQTSATLDANSVMTDRNGQANFTELTPGTYLVSNLIPIELGGDSILCICEVTIVAGRKNTLQIKETKGKCDVIISPLPACDANKQTASNR